MAEEIAAVRLSEPTIARVRELLEKNAAYTDVSRLEANR